MDKKFVMVLILLTINNQPGLSIDNLSVLKENYLSMNTLIHNKNAKMINREMNNLLQLSE